MPRTIVALATAATLGLAGLTAAPQPAQAQWWIAPAIVGAGIVGLGVGAAVAGGCNYGCGYGYYGNAFTPGYVYVPVYPAPPAYVYAPNVVYARPSGCWGGYRCY